HLAFARRQIEIAAPQRGPPGALRSRRPVLGDRRADGGEQSRVAERLGQEVHGAMLDRAHRGRDVAVPGYEYDRRVVALGNLPLQVEAVDVRQLDVED